MCVCVPINLCIHQSIYLTSFLFICVSVFVCLSIYVSIYLASFVSICLSMSVCLSICLSISLAFSPCVCLSMFICVSSYSFTCLTVRLASLFSVCQSVYLRLPVCLPYLSITICDIYTGCDVGRQEVRRPVEKTHKADAKLMRTKKRGQPDHVSMTSNPDDSQLGVLKVVQIEAEEKRKT